MARADRFVDDTKEDIVLMLDLVERAQAIAAARLQEYNSISDKGDMADEFNWSGVDMTKASFVAGMTALEGMETILGTGGGSLAEALYKFKIELS